MIAKNIQLTESEAEKMKQIDKMKHADQSAAGHRRYTVTR